VAARSGQQELRGKGELNGKRALNVKEEQEAHNDKTFVASIVAEKGTLSQRAEIRLCQ